MLSPYKLTVLLNYIYLILNILIGLLIYPLILDNLGIVSLGVFGLLFTLKSIFDIGIGWLSSSLIKYYINYPNFKSNFFILSFISNLLYGFIIFIIFLLYSYFLKKDFILSFIFFGLHVFLTYLMVPFIDLLVAEMKQYQAAFLRCFNQFLLLLFTVIYIIFFNITSLSKLFIIFCLASLLTSLFVLTFTNKILNISISFSKTPKHLLKPLFIGEGTKFFLNGISTILLLQLDVILIDYLYGSKHVGVYLLIWKIPSILIMLGWRLSEPLQVEVAKLIKDNKEVIKMRFLKFEKKMLFISATAGLFYLIFGRTLLSIWIGTNNVPEIRFMYTVSSLLIFFSILQRFYISANYYTKNLEIVTLLQFVELFFKVIFIIFFFDIFHELSPIAGWLTGFLVTFIFYRKNSMTVFT